jgi:polyketide synthase PksN
LQVSSFAELEENLSIYLKNTQEQGHWYRGQAKRHDVIGLFAADEDGQRTIAAWIKKGKYGKLLELWVKGLAIDWELLYTVGRAEAVQGTTIEANPLAMTPARPHRISLPTYPFAQERCWISSGASPVATTQGEPVGSHAATISSSFVGLHPLVQRNTSTLWEQQFSSIFRGDEFFLADHVILGQHIMPGVAYLEMARAAVAVACGLAPGGAADTTPESGTLLVGQAYRLHHIVWSRPLICDPVHPSAVRIVLEAQENGEIAFLICREDEQARASRDSESLLSPPQPVPTEEEKEEDIYCRGIVAWDMHNDMALDLSAVRARCPHQISASELYQHFRAQGLSYGSAFRGIEELRVGEGEGLARLHLPTAVARTRSDFVLHPSVLDATVQACIKLFAPPAGTAEKLQVPFALSSLSIIGEVPAQGWAWIRRRQSRATGLHFDVDLCDEAGRVAVQVRGLSVRPFPTKERQTMLFTPNWKEEAITRLRQAEEVSPPSERLVLLCNLPSVEASRIEARMACGGRCRVLKVKNGPACREQHLQETAVQLIRELQRLLQSKPAGQVQAQVVVAQREEASLLEALVGGL